MIFKSVFLTALLISTMSLNISCSSTEKGGFEKPESEESAQVDGAAADEASQGDEDLGDDFSEDEGEDFAEDGSDSGDEVEEGEPSDQQEVAQSQEDEFEDIESELSDGADPEENLSNELNSSSGAPIENLADTSAQPVNITNLKFKANNGGGAVVIDTDGSPTYKTRFNEATNQMVVEVENATLPKSLARPYIATEFGSTIKTINAYKNPGGSTVRVVIQMGSGKMPTVSTEGNSIIVVADKIESQSVAKTEQVPVDESETNDNSAEAWSYDVNKVKEDEKILAAQSLAQFMSVNNRFYGRRISVETTKDADVRDVLNFIADESGVNMVISDDVKGKIQLKLRQVPWDQAFMIVLRTKRLGYVRQGNVIRISTLEALEEETTKRQKVIEASKDLEPIFVRVIPISYAKVDDLTKQVSTFLTLKRGSATADKRTSSLIIRDTQEVITRLVRLIQELDVPPSQVMIESKIVEATETFVEKFGVNWGFSGSPVTVSDTGGANGVPITFNSGLNIAPLASDSSSAGLFNFNIGQLEFLGNLEAALQLEETKGNIKVISSPRIMTINNEQAQIVQSGEILSPQVTVDPNGGTTTTTEKRAFKLELTVTPQVTASGSVIMDMALLREFPGTADSTTGEAPKNSRQAKTKILVNNGQTAVIGGIFQNDVLLSEKGVPLLKDLPVFGWLFKSENLERVKTELLIFLTPRILNIHQKMVESKNIEEQKKTEAKGPDASMAN